MIGILINEGLLTQPPFYNSLLPGLKPKLIGFVSFETPCSHFAAPFMNLSGMVGI